MSTIELDRRPAENATARRKGEQAAGQKVHRKARKATKLKARMETGLEDQLKAEQAAGLNVHLKARQAAQMMTRQKALLGTHHPHYWLGRKIGWKHNRKPERRLDWKIT